MDIFIKHLFSVQSRLLERLPETKRYFYYEIKNTLELSKNPTAILVHGLRGVGKTIALLQNANKYSLYVRADSMAFKKYKLYNVIEFTYKNYNINRFLIDEIQSYENWENEIKDIYDDFPDIELIISGSSSIKNKKKAVDLSRRLKLIHARPLYLHEYVNFKTEKTPNLYSLEEILENPLYIAANIEKQYPNIYYLLHEYIRFGGLPLYFQKPDVIPLITNSLKKIIYVDVPFIVDNLSLRTLKKLENIIVYIAMSKPGEFSYEHVASFTELSKGSVYELISALNEADLLHLLPVATDKSSIKLRKRVKAYFTHPTLRHALLTSIGEKENIGAYREEFFYHHLKTVGNIAYPKRSFKEPDFEVKIGKNTYFFEIGKHKDKQGFINVVDSDKAKFPLYLFGFVR